MNKLWITCNTNQSITINSTSVAAIDLEYTLHYAYIISNTFQERSVTGVFNNAIVVALSPPAALYSYVIRNLTVFNPNVATVGVKINLLESGSFYNLDNFELGQDESYSSNGCLTSEGKLKLAS